MQRGRVTPRGLRIAGHARDVRLARLRRHVDAEPAVAHLADPPECGRTLTTEDDRRMRTLDGLGIRPDFGEAAELAAELGLFLGPQHLHDFQVFARTLGATFPGHAERGEFLGQPADAHPEVEAAARQLVQAGDFLGGHERVAFGHQADAGAEPQGFGLCRGVRQRGERIEKVDLHRRHGHFAVQGIRVLRAVLVEQHHVLRRPQRMKARLLDRPGSQADDFGVGRESHPDSEISNLHVRFLLCEIGAHCIGGPSSGARDTGSLLLMFRSVSF